MTPCHWLKKCNNHLHPIRLKMLKSCRRDVSLNNT